MNGNSSVSTTLSALSPDSSRHNHHRLSQDPPWDWSTSPTLHEEISRQHTNDPADETVNNPLCDIDRRSQGADDVTHRNLVSARLESDSSGTSIPQ